MEYHYTQCGLDNVYLHSGVIEHKTDYGPGISIANADGLYIAIALRIVLSNGRLNGQCVRFLRALLDLSQKDLADRIGAQRGTIARWEGKPNTLIPGPADRAIRFLAAEALLEPLVKGVVQALADNLSEIGGEPIGRIDLAYLGDVEGDQSDRWRKFG